MKKTNIKTNKGITLIALIITIIILLVLATVTIKILVDQGIIGRAQNVTEQYTIADEKEKIKLGYNDYKIAQIEDSETAEFKVNGAQVIKNGENNWIIIFEKTKNQYKITDGNITLTKGIELDKNEVILEIKPGETLTEKIIATLYKIEGDITWENSDNEVATIEANGNEVTITALRVGTTKVTAKCGEYSTTCIVKVVLSKGAFVEYDVEYTDVDAGYEYSATNGWRLLDYTDNGDGTLSNVRLISTGVPAKLNYSMYGSSNSTWRVGDSDRLNEFRKILGGDDYTFWNGTGEYYGLDGAAGLYYNFGDIKFAYGTASRGADLGYFTKIRTNGVTYDINNTEETIGEKIFIPEGMNATVRVLTLPEINKAIGREDIDSRAIISNEEDKIGLYKMTQIKNVIPTNNYKGAVVYWWIASPYPNAQATIACLRLDGFYYSTWDVGSNSSVRPVICLKSNVQLVDTNSDGVWEIKQ